MSDDSTGSNPNQNILIEFGTHLMDNRVPLMSKVMFMGALVFYTVSPIDLIPDILLPLGIVDDGAIILVASTIFIRHARQQIEMRQFMTEKDKNAPVPYYPPSGNSGCAEIVKWIAVAFMCVVIVSGIGMYISILSGVYTANQVINGVGEFFGASPSARVINTRTIVTSVQPLGQLVSVSSEVAQADINVTITTNNFNLCGHSANHVAQGVIEAGIDLTQVGDTDITYDEGTDAYTITLPSPQITSCRIEYIRQYERQGGNPGCSVDWDSVRLLAQYETTLMFASDSLEAGILSRAERETTLLMESFVEALTESTVEIVYHEASEAELPGSCDPQIPNGWGIDDETGDWVRVD